MMDKDSCKGVWVPLLTEWDENDKLDIDMFIRNAERLVSIGVHTIYTTGTDGEFYAMSEDEFKLIVDALAEVTKGTGTRNAVGTTAANTRDVMRLIDYCASRGIDAVMPAFPFWLAMADAEWKQFMQEMFRVAERIPVVFYNTPRSKRLLSARELGQFGDEMPRGFLGTKTTSFDFFEWCEHRFETPDLVHIPLEAIAVPALMAGGQAFISPILGAMNPRLALDWYQQCMDGRWETAMAFQMKLNHYDHTVVNRICRAGGYRAGRLSKAMTLLGRFNETHNRMREPYHGLPADMLERLRVETEKVMPELMASRVGEANLLGLRRD